MEAKYDALSTILPFLNDERQAPGMFYPINDDMFGLTEKQKELRQLVFDFARKNLIESTDEMSDEKSLRGDKRQLWKELDKLDRLLGVGVDKDYGGRGGCYMDLVIILEEWTRVSTSGALDYGNHLNHCVYPIFRFGTEKQKRNYLPKLCSGEHVGSMLMPKLEDGDQLEELSAKKQGNYYILNGAGYTLGSEIDILVVYAKTNRYHDGIFTAFIVDTKIEGCVILECRNKNKFGFNNCRVSVANVLGEKNKGAELLISCLDLECITLAGGPVGLMQAICDFAFEYAHTKKQFAKFKGKITDMYTKLCTSRNYLYTVARACDNGHIIRKDSSAVYLHCTQNAMEFIKDINEMLDGNIEKSTIRLLADVLIYQMGAGTNKNRRKIVSCMISHEYR